MAMSLTRTMSGLLGAAVILMSAACSTNPATGRLQFDQLSPKQEVALGQQAMPDLVESYGGEVDDPVLKAYVEEVGRKMVPYTEAYNPELPWEFILLDSDVINAFALPGGKVFMSMGLLREMTNEAQLAGVLGHEIGHVTAQHIDERLSQATLLELGITLGQAMAGDSATTAQAVGLLGGIGGQGFLLKFGRDQESESDMLGMRYMSLAGYDPRGQLQVMQILDEAQKEAGGGAPPEILSTHPMPSTRIDRIKELLRTEFAYTQNSSEYQLYEERFRSRVGNRLQP